MPKYGLVRNEVGRETNNFDDFREFEDGVLKDPEVEAIEEGPVGRRLRSAVFKLSRKVGRAVGLRPPYQLGSCSKYEWRIAILGGLAFRRCPNFLYGGKKAAYLFDSFEPWATVEQIKHFTEDAGISFLFVPHPDCAEELSAALTTCRVYFVPEAAEPEGYVSDSDKKIDVMSFGRKLVPYHESLLENLRPGVVYKHGWQDTRADFLAALGSARIAVNFPRTMTTDHCDVEMLTMRYFQAMGSKALMLGHCPKVLSDLFGYDPVIKADLDNPAGQIHDILDNYESYLPLIEKNYQTFVEKHTFSHRWKFMKQVIEESPS